MRRRAILPPMRPNPTMASCMANSPFQSIGHGAAQNRRGPRSTFDRWMRNARRLRSFSTAKSPCACASSTMPNEYFFLGTAQIARGIGGDLQEHAGIGSALVGLPGRVQKARAEADDRWRSAWRGAGQGAAHRGASGALRCARYRRAARDNRRLRRARNALRSNSVSDDALSQAPRDFPHRQRRRCRRR